MTGVEVQLCIWMNRYMVDHLTLAALKNVDAELSTLYSDISRPEALFVWTSAECRIWISDCRLWRSLRGTFKRGAYTECRWDYVFLRPTMAWWSHWMVLKVNYINSYMYHKERRAWNRVCRNFSAASLLYKFHSKISILQGCYYD